MCLQKQYKSVLNIAGYTILPCGSGTMYVKNMHTLKSTVGIGFYGQSKKSRTLMDVMSACPSWTNQKKCRRLQILCHHSPEWTLSKNRHTSYEYRVICLIYYLSNGIKYNYVHNYI